MNRLYVWSVLLWTYVRKSMDQSDITYILEILTDAKTNKDWDQVDDAIESLKEFLDEETAVGDE